MVAAAVRKISQSLSASGALCVSFVVFVNCIFNFFAFFRCSVASSSVSSECWHGGSRNTDMSLVKFLCMCDCFNIWCVRGLVRRHRINLCSTHCARVRSRIPTARIRRFASFAIRKDSVGRLRNKADEDEKNKINESIYIY